MTKDLNKDISTVVITKDRVSSLTRTLKKLLELPEKFSIIVVDNGSSDGTAEVIKEKFPQVQLIALEKNMGAVGRNIAIEHAKTPFIAITDDDSWWRKGSFETAISLFHKYSRLGLIEGKILVRGRKVDPICKEMSCLPMSKIIDLPGPSLLGFMGCGAIIRKKAFLNVGGFKGEFGIGGEESLLAFDLAANGWGLAYVKNIIAYHYPSPIRNKTRRKQLGVRNWLWVTWMRRPIRNIFKESFTIFKYSLHDIDARTGFVESVKGIPWALKNRKVLPMSIENQLRTLNYFKL